MVARFSFSKKLMIMAVEYVYSGMNVAERVRYNE